MKVFVLMHHFNDQGYGAWETTILKIYTSKQSAEDHLKQLEASLSWDEQFNTPDDNRYSIEEHLIKS